jgi:hypothetical protein
MYAITSLYRNLLDDVGINSRPLTSDLDVETARKIWLIDSFKKKYVDESSRESADKVCLDKFLVSNDSCRAYRYHPTHIFHDVVTNEVKASFDDVVFRGPELKLDLASISAGFGLGPGANIGCESYDFYTKLFNSPLTRTSDRLYREYRCAIADYPLVSQAELLRSAHKGDSLVTGSLLSFVPKTCDVSRSICTEPTLNMLFQKGIGAYLQHELHRKYHIDLSKQPVLNRKLARIGSKDGSFGTIDLSSASDSISIELVRLLVPDVLFRWLMLARSPETVLPDGTTVKLDMISSMGNAFTFPLMTLIFASLVTACYRVMGLTPQYGTKQNGPQNFAVFGDDIIVLKEAYEFISSTLRLFGFSVNESKSFNTGYFRESCGGDYFKGHQIRGIYLKELSHESHVYSAFNRIMRWSSSSGIMLPKTLASLYDCVPPERRLIIPYSDGDAEGFKMPSSLYDEFYSRLGRSLLSRDPSASKNRKSLFCKGFVDTQQGIVRLGASSRAYLALVAVPKSYSIPYDKADGERVPVGTLPGFIYNGPGLFITFLGGFIRNGRIALRTEGTNRTNVRRRYSSSWDWASTSDLDGRDLFWEFTVEQYLRVPCTDFESCVGPRSIVRKDRTRK